MKMTALILLIACMQVSARSLGQVVTIKVSEMPLTKIFAEVTKQTGVEFFYRPSLLTDSRPVTATVKSMPLSAFLDLCFEHQPLSYTIKEKTVFIFAKKQGVSLQEVPAAAAPRDSALKARVTNEQGDPLSNATVLIKGSERGTNTNFRGEFELRGINGNETLIVSYVGYETKLMLASKLASNPIVMLAPATGDLDKLVVQAYGSTSRRLTTSSISSVSGEEIRSQPVANALGALEARVAGMIVTQSNGVPGSGYKVEVRGKASIGLQAGFLPSNDPLFIVDGVPFAANNTSLNTISTAAGTVSPLNSIDPNSIESIEVLKDADATAIYGSRGAKGVVLITTRKGHAGKTSFSLNVNSGGSKVTRSTQWLNTQQYLAIRREAFANDGIIPNATNAPDLFVWDTTRYTDIKKTLIGGTAKQTDVSADIVGGNNNTQFLIDGSYHRETSVFPGDQSLNRGSGMFKLNHTSNDRKFTANASISYSYVGSNFSTTDLTNFLTLAPNVPAFYDSTGKLNWQKGGVTFANPLSYLSTRYRSQTANMMTNVALSYRIIPGLVARVNGGYNTLQNDETSQIPLSAQDPSTSPLGSSNFGNSSFKSWLIEPQLEYSKSTSFGKFNFLAGSTFQDNVNQSLLVNAIGYTSDALLGTIRGSASSTSKNTYTDYRYTAFFGRLTYNWMDKYIVNLTGRRDGSSRFGPGKQFGNFGAVGGAWLFTNESFFSRMSRVLSYGKLRGSYGVTGSDQIGDYKYLDSWTATTQAYNGTPGLIPSRLFNPDFGWEVNRKLEVAADIGLFKDRILLSGAFYRSRSGNQLISYSTPIQTGFANISAKNFPAVVENRGFEITATWKNIATKDFTWSNRFNITIPTNRLIAFPGIENTSYNSTLTVGQSLTSLRVFHLLGVNDTTGVFQFADSKGNPTYTPKNPTDQIIINVDPKYYGGFENTFRYKEFNLTLFFDFRKQQGQNYLSSLYGFNLPGYMANVPTIILDRWRQSGDHSSIQRLTTTTGAAYAGAVNLAQSDGIYSDASFIRLKTVNLSWTVPANWATKMHITRCMFYLRAQNLFTITKYKGLDPETQSYTTLPPLKTIVGGLQVSF